MQASQAVAELQAENKRLAGLLSEAEVAAEGAAQMRDALEAKSEAEVLQVHLYAGFHAVQDSSCIEWSLRDWAVRKK